MAGKRQRLQHLLLELRRAALEERSPEVDLTMQEVESYVRAFARPSLRDQFAGQALSGFCAANPKVTDPKRDRYLRRVGKSCYRLADALMEARENIDA